MTPAKPGDLSPQNILPLSPNGPVPGASVTPPKSKAKPAKAPRQRRLRWPGVVVPLLFLILAAIMVYLVLDLSEVLPHSRGQVQKQEPSRDQGIANLEARRRAANPPRPRSRIVTTDFARKPPVLPLPGPPPDPTPNPNPPATPERTTPGSTFPQGDPSIEDRDRHVDGEVPLPNLIDLNEPKEGEPKTKTASQVLEEFLAARSLDERRPYLSKSRRSETVLAGSALAKPLPEVVLRRRVPYVHDSSKRCIEHFFEVSFQQAPDRIASPILVQLNEWGDGKIRIHTDAFLDLYNDELSIFGRNPVEGERTFHVVADAYKNCFDESIPDASRKGFIKLRTHPRITPRLKAYFSKEGSLASQIADPDGLPWGSSDVCTVTLRWNTQAPSQPFVELIRIDGFGTWNP